MFLTKPYKILSFSKRQNWPKATKIAPAVCSMLTTYLQDITDVISGLNVCRLTPKSLQHHLDTNYIWKQICHTL